MQAREEHIESNPKWLFKKINKKKNLKKLCTKVFGSTLLIGDTHSKYFGAIVAT